MNMIEALSELPIREAPIAGPGHNLRDPLEVELADAMSSFRERFDARKGEIERAKVTNDDEAGRATALAGILADIAAAAEKKRVELKEPYLKASRKIDGDFGGFLQIVKDAKAKVVALIDTWRAEQRRIADQERMRLAREAAEREEQARKAAEDGNALAAARLETKAQEAAEAAATVAAPTVIHSAYGQSASGRKEWRSEITDYSKLPPSVFTHPKVKEAMAAVVASLVRAGHREIPGVRVWCEEKTVIRK